MEKHCGQGMDDTKKYLCLVWISKEVCKRGAGLDADLFDPHHTSKPRHLIWGASVG